MSRLILESPSGTRLILESPSGTRHILESSLGLSISGTTDLNVLKGSRARVSLPVVHYFDRVPEAGEAPWILRRRASTVSFF